jgi:hypothetical protein
MKLATIDGTLAGEGCIPSGQDRPSASACAKATAATRGSAFSNRQRLLDALTRKNPGIVVDQQHERRRCFTHEPISPGRAARAAVVAQHTHVDGRWQQVIARRRIGPVVEHQDLGREAAKGIERLQARVSEPGDRGW